MFCVDRYTQYEVKLRPFNTVIASFDKIAAAKVKTKYIKKK